MVEENMRGYNILIDMESKYTVKSRNTSNTNDGSLTNYERNSVRCLKRDVREVLALSMVLHILYTFDLND